MFDLCFSPLCAQRILTLFSQNFSSVRNAYVAKLKSLKEAKKTGVPAPIATQISGMFIQHYHEIGS
jgi:hypothetical protein